MTLPALAPPSRNPTVDKRLKTVLRFVFNKLIQSSLDDMLPASVVAYNRTTNLATVQPLIQVVTTLNVLKTRSQIASVPVLQVGAGGFMTNFPLKRGDLGWIKANDRDISLFTKFWRLVQPNTKRQHSFEDCVFIPSILTNFTIDEEDEENGVFQKIDASTRIALWEEFVKITAARGLGVNVQPDENTIFDVQSITKASMPWPRMTESQRDAIPDPQEGMVIWNLTTHGTSVYNGTIWS